MCPKTNRFVTLMSTNKKNHLKNTPSQRFTEEKTLFFSFFFLFTILNIGLKYDSSATLVDTYFVKDFYVAPFTF